MDVSACVAGSTGICAEAGGADPADEGEESCYNERNSDLTGLTCITKLISVNLQFICT